MSYQTSLANRCNLKWAELWKPPIAKTVSEWAEEHRRLPKEATSDFGKWKNSKVPYAIEAMDAIHEEGVQTSVFVWGSQTTKTEVLLNTLGYLMQHDPSPTMMLLPTLDLGKAWSKDRLSTTIRDTPVLRELVDEQKYKSRDNTTLYKSFPGGHLTIAGANSASSLSSRPIRTLFCDEVDRYPPSAGSEGDPVDLAWTRTETFWNKHLLLASTPTEEGASRIWEWFMRSDQRYYYVPCPQCGEMQRLVWKNIIFDKEFPEDAYYMCVNTCRIDHNSKENMLANGEWRAQQESRKIAGFHLNSLYSPFVDWGNIVSLFLQAKGDAEKMRVWTNTRMAETFAVGDGRTDPSTLMQRREAYDENSLPEAILYITCAVDVQKDRLELLVQGWADKRERWNIEHHIIWGDTGGDEVWSALDSFLLNKKYKPADWAPLPIAICCVDAGYRSQKVYNFCQPRQGRRVLAVMGSKQYMGPAIHKPKQVGRQRVLRYDLGIDTIKDMIHLSSLDIEPDPHGMPTAGCIHFPQNVGKEFFDQLTAEVRVRRKTKGQTYVYWEQKRERDEINDLHVYNEAASMILLPDTAAIRQRREKALEPEPEAPKPRKSTHRAKLKRRKNNWMDI